MEIVKIAKTCHEVNRALCSALGDDSQVPWADAPEWQRKSAVDGVVACLRGGDDYTPEKSHANWLEGKVLDGWKWGPVKDAEAKTHPCMVPYDQLPEEQRLKDSLFVAIVQHLG